MPYLFEKDYTDKVNLKTYTKGTVFRIREIEVVNNNGEWVFDLGSPYGDEYGKIVPKQW